MKRVAVFGGAKSGVAAANFLAARGESVVLTDSRPASELALEGRLDPRVQTHLGGHPGSLLEDASMIILSPGIPSSIPILKEAAERGIPILSEIELAFRHLEGPVIAITGSNGKSTTTALIGAILQQAGREPIVAGNIGEPLIASVAPGPRVYVVELSSFQLETIDSFRPDVALLLNITPDHLDRYDSIDEYAAAKQRIFRNQTPADLAILNADDARVSASVTDARVLRFSSTRRLEEGAFIEKSNLVLREGGVERTIPRANLRLAGMANVENALAAWLATHALGVGIDHVSAAFESFAGLPHRMVLVLERNGVSWINDSKGTNVDASLKSLEGMSDGSTILIVGGKDKKGEFEKLRDLVSRKARAVLTIGSSAERIAGALSGVPAEIIDAGTMEKAVQWARRNARPGDTVLLSPACASFDQYDNFEHRGRHFEELVRGSEEVA
ncbi:MAG TPA: UDP-N-acetylmuramoyl-L-alanine--D-glutamate ligase [Thermoanaerobaculia bacterium]|nr:UDP-N-acetylmuramoyl-L-alanine--D-glutamate ligase [Thermoanaerobaculia bacterium]